MKQAILTKEALAVIEAAEAYMDQLNSFNLLDHPDVVKQRAKLAEAVALRLNTPAEEQTPIAVEEPE